MERHAHREICSRCHEVSRVGFAVPNDIWELATHHSEREAIICLACFAKLADERGVEWDRDIKLFPVSWATLKSIVDKQRQAEISSLHAQLAKANDPTWGDDHWEPGDPGH